MKIAVVIDTWFPAVGGGQINAWEISKRLASKNFQIDIITRNCGNDNLKLPRYLKVIKIGTLQKSDSYFSKIKFILESLFFVLRKDYDLVHAHAFLPGITSKLLMVLKSIPAVFTVHGTSIGTNLNNPLFEFVEKVILTWLRADAQITVSRDFLKFKNVNKNIFYIPNGVDIRQFNKIKTPKVKKQTLIFVGRLHPQKNLKNLIDAIKILKKEYPRIFLKIVGDGLLKDSLNFQIRKNKLSKNISMLGQIRGKALVKEYKSSGVFVLPSIYEGQPLTLLEAWASKLPVVVSKTGDCPYLIRNGHNGFLIDNQNDSHDIAKTLKRALETKNLSNLGKNGYSFVTNNLTWEKSAEKTLKVYEKFASA